MPLRYDRVPPLDRPRDGSPVARGAVEPRVRRIPRLAGVKALLERRGFAAILAARLMPGVPATGLYYAVGVSAVRRVEFIAAIAIGGRDLCDPRLDEPLGLARLRQRLGELDEERDGTVGWRGEHTGRSADGAERDAATASPTRVASCILVVTVWRTPRASPRLV
jgi:hypothetical protein